MIAQSVPLQTKGHTYAMCIYTVGRRPPQSHSEHDLKFSRFLQVRRNVKQTSSFKIGQAMDFYLASDSSPAIHSKTIAKVRKRIGICKKIGKFLANPNKIGYKAAYIQGFCPYRAQGNNALIPRVLPWARSFCPFRACRCFAVASPLPLLHYYKKNCPFCCSNPSSNTLSGESSD